MIKLVKEERYVLMIVALLLGAGLSGCNYFSNEGPKELLDKYFSSAVKQDYGTTYDCYYGEYGKKVSRDEYIRRRKDGSVLQSYRIVSLNQKDGTAQAQVLLTFAASEKANRKDPASVMVTEDMQREGGGWKIKVWQ
jgi:hypothetical protein